MIPATKASICPWKCGEDLDILRGSWDSSIFFITGVLVAVRGVVLLITILISYLFSPMIL